MKEWNKRNPVLGFLIWGSAALVGSLALVEAIGLWTGSLLLLIPSERVETFGGSNYWDMCVKVGQVSFNFWVGIGVVVAFLSLVKFVFFRPRLAFGIAGAVLFLTAFAPTKGNLPRAYVYFFGEHFDFRFIRLVVCVAGCYGAFQANKRKGWFWAMVALAVVFNPLHPFHLAQGEWQLLDVAGGTLLWVATAYFKEARKFEVDE